MPRPESIEVRTSAGSTHVGQLAYSPEFTETIAKAEEALALLGREKLFERQRTTEYPFLIHFESVAELQEYLEHWASYYEPMPEGFMETIEDLMGAPGAEIVLDTRARGTTFKKLG